MIKVTLVGDRAIVGKKFRAGHVEVENEDGKHNILMYWHGDTAEEFAESVCSTLKQFSNLRKSLIEAHQEYHKDVPTKKKKQKSDAEFDF